MFQMADFARKPFVPRALTDRWDAASDQFPVLALAGPWQVGKTTLLDHIRGPERRIVSLDFDLGTLARRRAGIRGGSCSGSLRPS